MRFGVPVCVFAAASIAAILSVEGQDAAPPNVDPGPTPPTSPAPIETPSSVVPDLSQLDQGFKETSLGKAADESRTRLEWRKLANTTAGDPAVVAARQAADAAATDLEKRRLLRKYYELYYGKMHARASTPEMKEALEKFKNEHLAMLTQPRVRPEEAAGMPTPTPTPKGKGKDKDKKKEKSKSSKFRPGQ